MWEGCARKSANSELLDIPNATAFDTATHATTGDLSDLDIAADFCKSVVDFTLSSIAQPIGIQVVGLPGYETTGVSSAYSLTGILRSVGNAPITEV